MGRNFLSYAKFTKIIYIHIVNIPRQVFFTVAKQLHFHKINDNFCESNLIGNNNKNGFVIFVTSDLALILSLMA